MDYGTCTPPSINNNWIVDAADKCVITDQAIDLGTGQYVITGDGFMKFINSSQRITL